MAIPVARVHLAMAHAALPGLLPTPPVWKMAPLLPTPPCAVVILPKQSPPTKLAGRADAADRWDAHKNVKRASAASSSSSGSSQRSSPDGSTGRASSCARWDSNKKMKKSASSSSLCSSSSSSSLLVSRAAASPCGGRDGSKQPVSRGSSSAERWDAHKKPRAPPQADALDDGGEDSSTGSNDVEVDEKPQPQQRIYAGPGFLAPPEPSMLPMPSFLARPRCIVA